MSLPAKRPRVVYVPKPVNATTTPSLPKRIRVEYTSQPVNEKQRENERRLKAKVEFLEMDNRALTKKVAELTALLADTPEGRLARLEQYGRELTAARPA